jgi:hypothetical protein
LLLKRPSNTHWRLLAPSRHFGEDAGKNSETSREEFSAEREKDDSPAWIGGGLEHSSRISWGENLSSDLF